MHSHQHLRTGSCAALVLMALALAGTLLSPRAGAAFNATSPTENLPSLSGATAVEHLKQQGLYQALAAAQANALIGQQTKLTANDGAAHDYFGNAVAISGDTAVIGAPFDDVSGAEQGSAYVFVRSGSSWTQQARLNALDGGTNDGFGRAVAISGNTVIVGAYGDESDRGSAYVFVRSGVTWSQQQKLIAADGVAADNFGSAVALSGETVVIGAPAEDLSTPQSKGAAYVFVRSGVTWSQQQKLVAADGLIDEEFGATVALSGETIVIGNYNKQIGSNPNQGAAYVFLRSGTIWTQQQKLTAADGAAGDSFGSAVALSGDTLLVGAPYDVTGANVNQGAAYVFGRSGASWSQVQKLTASDAKAQDCFGNAVALSGSTLVIGAANIAANNNQGKAYVFARNGASWQQQEILTATDGASGDRFGGALALSGDTIVTGAASDLIGANVNQGSAYVFVIRDDTLAQQQRLVAADGVNNDQFGTEVALNGNTAVVSVTQDSHGNQSGLGAVYVFVRNGATWTQQAKLLAGDGAVGDYFGQALALSGDTLAVGAPEDDIGAKVDQGSVYIFVRNGAVWSQQVKLVNGLGAAGDRFGGAVALQGNTLVCGISYAQIGGMPKRGAAFVFVRNGVTWNSQALLTASDGAADDVFGSAVALNGDTAVIGSPVYGAGGLVKPGAAYAFVRNGSAWSQQAKLTAADGTADDEFGGAVALDGNTLVVGAGQHSDGANEGQGAAYVFLRNGAAWSQQQKLTVANGALGDHFGRAVALSGDTLMIGAFWRDVVTVNAGAVYSFTRSGATWTPQQQFATGLTETRFGWSVAFDGDTVLIGAPYEPFATLRGAAYLYAANTCPALGFNPATLANGTAGVAYNQSLTVSGGTAPYDFSVSFGALPPGLTLSPSGLLSGTPAVGGSYSFTITATAATLCPGSRAYTLVIASNCPAISVSPAAVVAGTTGQPYSQMFTASGGAAPYTFTVSAGAVPNGLTLAANGVLTGTPALAGIFNFTVKATDSNGCFGTRSYSVTIQQGCGALLINPAALPTGISNAAYNQTLTVNGGTASYTFSVTGGVLPAGLTLTSGGLLSGMPTSNGTYNFNVNVVDANNCGGAKAYALTIANNVPPQPLTAKKGDFDGDGKADLAAWTGATGNWAVLNSGNGTLQTTLWGAGYAPYFDVIVPGDYDGDGKVDHAIWRGADSIWYIRKSSNGQAILDLWGANYAPYFDVPQPGDFDGDGKTDLAVWRPSTGTWYVKRSSDGSSLVEVWGQAGDTAVAADYDGDGKADFAVWRPTDGNWLIKQSSGGTQTILWGAGYAPYFDVPVPADFDGDGKADLAIWRGQDSLWYIRPSATPNTPVLQLWGANYAPYNDVPTPADYDGDGKADIAVWRPTTGTWYVLKSSNGTNLVQQHGQNGDTPVPAHGVK